MSGGLRVPQASGGARSGDAGVMKGSQDSGVSPGPEGSLEQRCGRGNTLRSGSQGLGA